MSNKWTPIEEFLRSKLRELNHSYQGDWGNFEKKLSRAVFFRRMRYLTGFTAIFALVASLTFFYDDLSGLFEDTPSQPVKKQIGPRPEISVFRLPEKTATPVAKNKTVSLQKNIPQTSSDKKPGQEKNTFTGVTQTYTDNAKEKPTRLRSKNFPKITAAPDPSLLKIPTDRAREKLVTLDAKTVQQTNDINYVNSLRVTSFAQEEKASNEPYISPLQEKNPWSYSFNIYPNFTFRKFYVDPANRAYLHSDFIDAMESSEKTGFSLNLGFEISRRIGAITYLNGGMQYITNRTKVNYNFTNFRNANIEPATGKILNYSLLESPEQITFSGQNTFHYLNFPLSLSYQPWASDHIRLNIEFGGSLMYFVSAEGRSLNYKTLEVIDLKSREYRKFIGSFGMKIGAQYFVTEHINVGFEPSIRYLTNTIYTSEYPFTFIPYSVGVNFNVQVKLN